MALRKDEEWLLPENLHKQERSDILDVERGADASAGDFGSYYRLLKTGEDDWARIHAVMDSQKADLYAGQVAAALEAVGDIRRDGAWLDAGCGPGVITDALRRRFRGEATGIDISESAIQYARKRYPRCRFEAVGLDKDTVLSRKYDIIHAREFYPFTRTNDIETHRQYMDICAGHLNDGGAVLITVLAQEKSLAVNAPALCAHLAQRGLSPWLKVLVASDKFCRIFPLPLAKGLTFAGQRLLGRPSRYFYIAHKHRAVR